MNRHLKRLAPLAVIFLAISFSQASEELLNIGSKAPEIQAAKWVKGTPLSGFVKGKIYVMEFWATWCGPCKAAMPHLSELARKYKDRVSVTGVDVLESGEDITRKVEAFVNSMGEKMDYSVCVDGSAGFMANHWLRAAGESGIPCTFVVNGEGRIAWIGHPNGLEDVLEQVLAGTDDYRELAKSREASKAGTAIEPSAAREIKIAIDAKNYAGTVETIDWVAGTNPVVARKFQAEKLRALMFTDEAKGLAFARDILDRSATNSPGTLDLLKSGALVAGADGLTRKAYEMAIEILTKACETEPAKPAPGMMQMHVNVEAVKRLIKATRTKAAAAKD